MPRSPNSMRHRQESSIDMRHTARRTTHLGSSNPLGVGCDVRTSANTLLCAPVFRLSAVPTRGSAGREGPFGRTLCGMAESSIASRLPSGRRWLRCRTRADTDTYGTMTRSEVIKMPRLPGRHRQRQRPRDRRRSRALPGWPGREKERHTWAGPRPALPHDNGHTCGSRARLWPGSVAAVSTFGSRPASPPPSARRCGVKSSGFLWLLHGDPLVLALPTRGRHAGRGRVGPATGCPLPHNGQLGTRPFSPTHRRCVRCLRAHHRPSRCSLQHVYPSPIVVLRSSVSVLRKTTPNAQGSILRSMRAST